MTSSRFRRHRSKAGRRPVPGAGFPAGDRDATEVLGRADWDGRTIQWGGASGAGLPDGGVFPGEAGPAAYRQAIAQAGAEAGTGPQAHPHGHFTGTGDATTWHPAPGREERRGIAPAPLTRLRAQPPGPATFPALPDPPAPPAPQPPRRPQPWEGYDLAIPVQTRDGHGILCGLCCWRRHADPRALTFRALRQSAWTTGWRKDMFGNWACRPCQAKPGFRAPSPVTHHDPATAHARSPGDWPARHWLQHRGPVTGCHPDAPAAWVARDPAAEFWLTVEAEVRARHRAAGGASQARRYLIRPDGRLIGVVIITDETPPRTAGGGGRHRARAS